MGKGLTVTLHFLDGKPDGMLTAVEFNWQGRILKSPRTKLNDVLQRKETTQPGVYILLGETDEGPSAYIGESDEIKKRMSQHIRDDKWDWNDVIIITSSADNLNKAHIKYLEASLHELAIITKSRHLINAQKPTHSPLSEAEKSNMDGFLDNLMMVLPAIQVDMFVNKAQPAVTNKKTVAENTKAPMFQLKSDRLGINATAELLGGEMIVQSGSIVRKSWTGERGEKTHYFILHDKLMATGIIEVKGENSIFTQDYAFSSPSAAGAIVNGRSTSGPREWKLKGTNTTYAEWEAAQLAELDTE